MLFVGKGKEDHITIYRNEDNGFIVNVYHITFCRYDVMIRSQYISNDRMTLFNVIFCEFRDGTAVGPWLLVRTCH